MGRYDCVLLAPHTSDLQTDPYFYNHAGIFRASNLYNSWLAGLESYVSYFEDPLIPGSQVIICPLGLPFIHSLSSVGSVIYV